MLKVLKENQQGWCRRETERYKQLYDCCSSIFDAKSISYKINSKVHKIYLHNACKTLTNAKLMPMVYVKHPDVILREKVTLSTEESRLAGLKTWNLFRCIVS